MKRKNQVTRQRNNTSRSGGSTRWQTYALMIVCGLLLVCGFFFAGRQHFSSMDYGMKNSRLRKQVDDLEAEKRRLLLAREISLSPAEIKKAAKKTGMVDAAAINGEIAQVASTTREKATPPQVSDVKSMVVKTAAVSPVGQRAAVYPNVAKLERPRKTMAAE